MERADQPSGPLRVAFLGHGAERTGPPVYLLRLLEWLRDEPSIDPAVFLLRDGPLLSEFEALAPVWLTDAGQPARRSDGTPGPPGAFDVAYVNTAGSVEALASLPTRPPIVVTHVHELSVGLDYFLSPELKALALDDADHVWAVADVVADAVAERTDRPRDQILVHRGVLPTGFGPGEADTRPAPRDALGIPADAFVVGAAGTLDWRKAPELMATVAALVAERTPRPVHFIWVGGDPQVGFGQEALADAETLGIADRLHFVGEQPDIRPWLGLLDLFLLTSREDAYPLVCLEAAAWGLPLAGFGTGGLPELVGADAGVVIAYPDLAALADAIVALSGDAARRRAMGDAARRRAADHDVSRAGPRLVADLLRVSGRHG